MAKRNKRKRKPSPNTNNTPDTSPDKSPDDAPEDALPEEERDAPPLPEPVETRLHLGWHLRIAFSFIAGAFIFLSFATYNVWSLAYFGLVPLLVVIHDRRPRGAFGWGFLMGFVTNFGGFYWITGLLMDFGHLAWPIALFGCVLCCAYQGLVFGFWAWFIRAVGELRPKWPVWSYAIPGMLALELVFPMIFPWYLGNSQYIFYPAIQIADIFGVLGVTLELLLVNLALYEIVAYIFITPKEERRSPAIFVGVAFALYAAAIVYGVVRIDQIDAEMNEARKLRVGMVEGNIGISEKEERSKLVNNILIHQNLSKQLADAGAELIVWPESSYQSDFIWGSKLKTEDRLLLELDSMFVPEFRDQILPAMRALEVGFGRPLHHFSGGQRALDQAAAKVAVAAGYKPIPPNFPAACGEPFGTAFKCPFIRVPPDDVTFFLPSWQPLAPEVRTDFLRKPQPLEPLAPTAAGWGGEVTCKLSLGGRARRRGAGVRLEANGEVITGGRGERAFTRGQQVELRAIREQDGMLIATERFDVPREGDCRMVLSVFLNPRWVRNALQRSFGTALLYGGLSARAREGQDVPDRKLYRAKNWERHLHNVAFLVDKEGHVRGNYKKVYLLLFGETIPFSDYIPWVYEWIPESTNFTAGTEMGLFEHDGIRMGVLICYEDILPRYTQQLGEFKPQVLINVTNDAWFGKTSEPYLHLQLAIFRSVEMRTWMVRSTNTGVSAFIDANGRIVKETSLDDAEVIMADVAIMSGEPTLYVRMGDVLGWLSLIGFIGLVVFVRRERRRLADAS